MSCSHPKRAPIKLVGSTACEASSKSTVRKWQLRAFVSGRPAAAGCANSSASRPEPTQVLTTTGACNNARRPAAASAAWTRANCFATHELSRAACAEASAAVLVFPVPGGPWMRVSRRCSAAATVPACEGFRSGPLEAAATAAKASLTNLFPPFPGK
eukprot:scaffold70006_cov31-Tisochrysis_lutea.AAC.2